MNPIRLAFPTTSLKIGNPYPSGANSCRECGFASTTRRERSPMAPISEHAVIRREQVLRMSLSELMTAHGEEVDELATQPLHPVSGLMLRIVRRLIVKHGGTPPTIPYRVLRRAARYRAEARIRMQKEERLSASQLRLLGVGRDIDFGTDEGLGGAAVRPRGPQPKSGPHFGGAAEPE